MIAAGSPAEEHASLWFELARMRLLRGDPEADKALASLAKAEGGLWLGRVLGAYALGLPKPDSADPRVTRSPEQIELLAAAEEDPGMARALRVVAAILRVRTGDKPAAVERLRVLHEEDAGDLLVGVLLADLERAAGDVAAAARALSGCARLVEIGRASCRERV